MNIPLIRLELRKNRLAAASAAAAFLVTLPVCRLVSSATGLELRLSLDAALTGWVLLGVPLAAALIGAASGAASGSRDALEAEGLLPPSPGRRALSAMTASLLLTAAFAAFVLAVGALLGKPPAGIRSPEQMAWGASFWHNLPLTPVLALASFDVLAGAWALSRLIGHGVAGGLLALLLTAASGAGVAACFGLELLHNQWGASCYASAVAIASFGALAKVWAGALAARWAERRCGARILARALALLVLPGLMIWGRAGAEMRMLDAKLAPIGHGHSFENIRGYTAPEMGSGAAAGEGAVFKTLRGGVVLAGAAGVRVLIPEQSAGLSYVLLEPFKTWIRSAWRDDQGVLWVERYVSPNTELWRVEGSKVESLRLTGYGSISMVAGTPLMHRYPGGKRLLVARVEDYFRRGDKAAWFEGYRDIVAMRRREAGAGRVACGGKCFEAEGRRWKLPGISNDRDAVFPREFGGRRAYLVPVRNGDNLSMALCRADGSTVAAWPGYHSLNSLPDGTIFSLWKGTLWSIGPDGTVAAPVGLDPPLPDSTQKPMRIAEGKAWLVSRGKLTVVDAAGRAVLTRPLPEDIEDAIPLKDGFVITTRRSAYFSDWNGKLRRVENPR
ncbi:MAG: hypothetical protein Q8T11_08845 [Elusimicrobiota bacterium]|nr:hypothetical protein [Elusimicrobiota bacterium]